MKVRTIKEAYAQLDADIKNPHTDTLELGIIKWIRNDLETEILEDIKKYLEGLPYYWPVFVRNIFAFIEKSKTTIPHKPAIIAKYILGTFCKIINIDGDGITVVGHELRVIIRKQMSNTQHGKLIRNFVAVFPDWIYSADRKHILVMDSEDYESSIDDYKRVIRTTEPTDGTEPEYNEFVDYIKNHYREVKVIIVKRR